MTDRERGEQVRGNGEDAYFAASNSAGGFRSWYEETFDDGRIGRLYAIKGGPGTGKSRFMRDVAEAGRAGGWRAEMIYCSSDPDSLDGIILTRQDREGIALLDATAPHVYEPRHPGYREEIVNLGAFWDAERLRGERETIGELNREKAAAYRRAYRYLSGVGELSETARELTAPFVREAALARFAAKLTRDIPSGSGFQPRTALMHGIGMRGRVMFDTFLAQADRIVRIEDCHGCAYLLMREIYRLAAEKQLPVRVSRDPILPERTDALFLPDSGIAFAVLSAELCSYPHRTISVRRFVDTRAMRRVREPLGYAERVRRVMLDGAVAELERAAGLHFRIEAIYERAMDFGAKEAYTRDFCTQLFGGKTNLKTFPERD